MYNYHSVHIVKFKWKGEQPCISRWCLELVLTRIHSLTNEKIWKSCMLTILFWKTLMLPRELIFIYQGGGERGFAGEIFAALIFAIRILLREVQLFATEWFGVFRLFAFYTLREGENERERSHEPGALLGEQQPEHKSDLGQLKDL